ncbi:MAG TPA: TMEM175 family protein [Candidatus Eisenbacteria bacterium]|nr:TMEM175 family protein [Candidatus Eisenbacteria bacterium]
MRGTADTDPSAPPGAERAGGGLAAADNETARLEAFSDGVFAIAITLLVLDLKVPHGPDGALGRELAAAWPSYVAFLASFATIGIMWLNHHRLFRLIGRADHGLMVANALLLLGITVVPFPTAVLSAHLGDPDARTAALLYAGTFVYIALAFNLLWRHASAVRQGRSLLVVPDDHPAVQEVHASFRVGPWSYMLMFALAAFVPLASVILAAALAAFYARAPRAELP